MCISQLCADTGGDAGGAVLRFSDPWKQQREQMEKSFKLHDQEQEKREIANDGNVCSKFELPPAEHPAYGGGGRYYEYTNGPGNSHVGIGYEFSSAAQPFRVEEDTTRSEYNSSNNDEQCDDADDVESGHGGDVGQEEDDPG